MLAVFAAQALTACSPAYFRRTTPAVVGSGLDELARDKARLDALLPDPDLEEASREIAKGLVSGGLEALARDARDEAIAGLADAYIDQVAQSLGNAGHALGADLRQELVVTVRAVADEMLSSEHRRDAAAMASAISSATARGLLRGSALGLEGELGPAMRTTLERDLGPGMETLVRNHLAPALASGARDVTREALLGVNDALDGELGETLADGQQSFWDQIDDRLQEGESLAERWFIVAMALLGLAVAVVGIAIAAFVVARRRHRAMRLMTEAVSRAQRHGSVEDILTEIKNMRDTSDHRDGYVELQSFLARHRHLKLPATPSEAQG